MVRPDSQPPIPHTSGNEVARPGGLYCTFVPSPDPLRERVLDAFAHVLRIVRPTFQFGGRRYAYFLHPYNRTVRGERCVEIPIVLEHVRAFAGRRILEVGNVLQHYDPFPHTVIDKYEVAPHVDNVDVVDYRPAEPFDLIVSVSTLEHVGWDEEPREPEKISAAFDNLVARCLKPGGRMVVTTPVGYNAFLDAAVASGAIAFTSKSYLRRRSRWAHWEACGADAVRGARYDHPYPFANALLIGVVDKPARGT